MSDKPNMAERALQDIAQEIKGELYLTEDTPNVMLRKAIAAIQEMYPKAVFVSIGDRANIRPLDDLVRYNFTQPAEIYLLGVVEEPWKITITQIQDELNFTVPSRSISLGDAIIEKLLCFDAEQAEWDNINRRAALRRNR